MKIDLTLIALIEIFCALSTGVAILFVTYKALNVWGKKKYGITDRNLAYNIFIASVLFSVGYMVSAVIQPILSSFRILSSTNSDSVHILLSFLGYSSLYVFIAYSSSLFVSLLGINIYNWLTPLDEFLELKNNNLGVAIVVSSIIITLTMMSKDGVTLLIESTIPYPHLPPISN